MSDRLAPRDQQVLDVRSIAPAIRDARGYRTVTAAEAPAYGFRGDQARDGLLIAVHNTQGLNGSYQLRPHDPRLNDVGKPIKYEWASGKPLALDVPLPAQPLLDDITVPLLITEAPLKADAIMSAAAPGTVAAVACVGVWGWRSGGAPLSDWRDIPLCTKQGTKIVTRRRVVILFDSDTATNPKVAYARHDLTEFLERRGAAVEHVDVPPDPAGAKQGVDDALTNGHTIAGLLATAHRPRPVDPGLVADDPDRQRIAELEATVAALEDELRGERAKRTEEHRILGDGRIPAQKRINAVVFNREAARIAQHGDGKLGRGGGLDPVVAVDADNAIFTPIKRLAESAGTSAKCMADSIKDWHDLQLVDRLPATRVRIGETVTRDGEIKPLYESVARVRPRRDLGTFLTDFFMATPDPKPRAKPQPRNRCLDHPDADLLRRTTTSCSVCHQEVAPERVAWVPAGTPPEIDDHNAAIDFAEIQNEPEVLSENEPPVRSEHGPTSGLSPAPTSLLPNQRCVLDSQLIGRANADKYTDLGLLGGRP